MHLDFEEFSRELGFVRQAVLRLFKSYKKIKEIPFTQPKWFCEVNRVSTTFTFRLLVTTHLIESFSYSKRPDR
jgi:hypothetical protein